VQAEEAEGHDGVVERSVVLQSLNYWKTLMGEKKTLMMMMMMMMPMMMSSLLIVRCK
jgi:hypothetical protein